MNRTFIVMALVAVLAASVPAAVMDDFESPAAPYDPLGNGWNSDAGWSTWGVTAGSGEGATQGNVWNNGSNWYELVTTNGVAAPANVGDYTVSESRFQIHTDPCDLTAANTYVWNFGFQTESDGSGTGAEMIFSRRATNILGMATTGDQSWGFGGWENVSTIGMTTGKNETSDWFGNRVKITKAAVGYDVLNELLANDGSVIYSIENLAEALPTMAAAPTWYGKMGVQSPLGVSLIDQIGMDNYALYTVPEPATLAIFGLGAMLLRRKK